MTDIMSQVEKRAITREVPKFEIGDTVDVKVRIVEGDKTRTQTFSGLVIAKKHQGLAESVTVRRMVEGEGVERTFPVHSPLVEGIEVKRHGVVRRAKLYYLRDRVGKATRLKERKVAAPVAEGEETKKKARKRGAKAKAERKARQAEQPVAKKKAKKKATAEAK